MSKDLLKEAIADAKAVRETAIANAKLALEEAFTPKIQSMLSAQISEEDEEEFEDELETSDEMESDVEDVVDDMEDAMDDADEMDDMDSEEDEDDMELESIIRELEAEMEDDTVEEEEDEDETFESLVRELESDEDEMYEEEDEELDLDEIIRELSEEDEDEMYEEEEDNSELEEAYSTIAKLKETLTEVNILNAKLLYSNKLFRNFNLSESQKIRVIENFDRAQTVREIKLVYSTLTESLKVNVGKKNIAEGLASKAVGSTKPKKEIINESGDFADRMKKLAGLL